MIEVVSRGATVPWTHEDYLAWFDVSIRVKHFRQLITRSIDDDVRDAEKIFALVDQSHDDRKRLAR